MLDWTSQFIAMLTLEARGTSLRAPIPFSRHVPVINRSRTVPKSVANSDISTKDWRSQKMSDVAHRFFDRIWSRGETQLIDELLAENFAYKDMIWAAKRPIVGVKAFKAYVEGMRTAYPDLYYEITSVSANVSNSA